MRLSQRHGLLLGLGLLSFAVVAFQIVASRVFAALLGPHLALPSFAVMLLGGAVGAALACVAPSLARPPRLFSRLAYLGCASSALDSTRYGIWAIFHGGHEAIVGHV